MTASKILSAVAVALMAVAGAAHAETYEGVHQLTSAASRADVAGQAVVAAHSANPYATGANAGPAPIAGEKCSPFWVSTAFQNDQMAESAGELANKDGVKSIYLLAPNYQGGKDNVQGFRRTYKGKVIGETLFKVGETDFQAELSLVRAAKPDALFIFAPAAIKSGYSVSPAITI